MKEFWVLSVWALCVTFVQPLGLPEFVKPCHIYAPDVDQCVLKATRETMPNVINGLPKYRVPVLDPVHLKELIVNGGANKGVGLSIVAQDVYIKGIKNLDIKDLKVDFKNKSMTYQWYFPELRINFIYNVTGKVLLLPVDGHGNGTILFTKVPAVYKFNWDEKKHKDGKEYYMITKVDLIVDPEKFSIKLENLFNGNKALGDTMNAFINENWREVYKDVAPFIIEGISEYIRGVLTNIFALVPKENLYIYDHV